MTPPPPAPSCTAGKGETQSHTRSPPEPRSASLRQPVRSRPLRDCRAADLSDGPRAPTLLHRSIGERLAWEGASAEHRPPGSAEGGPETTRASRWVRWALSAFDKSLVNLRTAYRIQRKLSLLIWLGVRAGVGDLHVYHVSALCQALL